MRSYHRISVGFHMMHDEMNSLFLVTLLMIIKSLLRIAYLYVYVYTWRVKRIIPVRSPYCIALYQRWAAPAQLQLQKSSSCFAPAQLQLQTFSGRSALAPLRQELKTIFSLENFSFFHPLTDHILY